MACGIYVQLKIQRINQNFLIGKMKTDSQHLYVDIQDKHRAGVTLANWLKLSDYNIVLYLFCCSFGNQMITWPQNMQNQVFKRR